MGLVPSLYALPRACMGQQAEGRPAHVSWMHMIGTLSPGACSHRTELTTESPLWVGAWWVGFLGAGAAAFLIAVPILGYPRQLPGECTPPQVCQALLLLPPSRSFGTLRDTGESRSHPAVQPHPRRGHRRCPFQQEEGSTPFFSLWSQVVPLALSHLLFPASWPAWCMPIEYLLRTLFPLDIRRPGKSRALGAPLVPASCRHLCPSRLPALRGHESI